MASVKIVSGKKGWHLRIDGLFVSYGFSDKGEPIKCLKSELGIPYGSTEWVSVFAVRGFWNKHMRMILSSVKSPYESVWGQFHAL